MDEKKEDEQTIFYDAFAIGGISIKIARNVTVRDIEFARLLMLAYKHANTILDERGRVSNPTMRIPTGIEEEQDYIR